MCGGVDETVSGVGRRYRMTFKVLQLIVDGDFLTEKDLQKISNSKITTFHHNSNFFKIKSNTIENRFLWIYCQFDNTELYNEYVWNDELKISEGNPRKKTQIECRYQLFICYDAERYRLYINDMGKCSFVKAYFKEILGKNVETKKIISSLEEFEKVVTTLKQVVLVQYNNLFNDVENSMFANMINAYGLDGANRLYMKVDFKNHPIEKMKNVLRKYRNKRGGEIEEVIIVGQDNQGVKHSFDFNSIVRSISIDANKNSNGHYSNEDIQKLLLRQIR